MIIYNLNLFTLDLLAMDFTDRFPPDKPVQGGPTACSRALAIIHLAARDAYAAVTGAYKPILTGLPASTLGQTEALGIAAAIGAALAAARLLYNQKALLDFINTRVGGLTAGQDPAALAYGAVVGKAWFDSRAADGSADMTMATSSDEPGHYRADPVSRTPALGAKWGNVVPFILKDVKTEAVLKPPPAIDSFRYARSFDDVVVNGRDDIERRDKKYRDHATIGIFWGYDGSNKLGTPPRLYNQVVVATAEFKALSPAKQLNVLAAINAAMADAGIAAWYWKYRYDFWRPVTAIREAQAGWGPTGKGDGNGFRTEDGDPFWLPLGAPQTNPLTDPVTNRMIPTLNSVTPNFPAYPSGHATFGTACFQTFAALIGKETGDITVAFKSDEFAVGTLDGAGVARPLWEQTFTLDEAIEQNKVSRIYLGVHWDFDADGGETVGLQIAAKVANAFA